MYWAELKDVRTALLEVNTEIEKIKIINDVCLAYIKASPVVIVSLLALTITVWVYQKTPEYGLDQNTYLLPLTILIILAILAIVFWSIVVKLNKTSTNRQVTKAEIEREMNDRVMKAKKMFISSGFFPEVRPNYPYLSFKEDELAICVPIWALEDVVGARYYQDMRYVDANLVERIEAIRSISKKYYTALIDFTRTARQQIESMMEQSEVERLVFSRMASFKKEQKIRVLLRVFLYRQDPTKYPLSDLKGAEWDYANILNTMDDARDPYSRLMTMKDLEKIAISIEGMRVDLAEKIDAVDSDIKFQFCEPDGMTNKAKRA